MAFSAEGSAISVEAVRRPRRYLSGPRFVGQQSHRGRYTVCCTSYGSGFVPLRVTGSDRRGAMTLRGLTEDGFAAWRLGLVAIRNGVDPSYSRLGAVCGKGSATLTRNVPVGSALYLIATPYQYQPLGVQPDNSQAGFRYPYGVTITGAVPDTCPVARDHAGDTAPQAAATGCQAGCP